MTELISSGAAWRYDTLGPQQDAIVVEGQVCRNARSEGTADARALYASGSIPDRSDVALGSATCGNCITAGAGPATARFF